MSAANNLKRAREALLYFHNVALKYPANYHMGFEELIQKLGSSNASLLNNLGGAIIDGGFSEQQIKEMMEQIAKDGEGRLPRRSGDWLDAMLNGARVSSWEVVKTVVSTVGSAADAVGKTALKTVENAGGLVTLVPYVLMAGLIFYIYERAKRA